MRRIPLSLSRLALTLGLALLVPGTPVQAADASATAAASYLPLPDPRQPTLRIQGSNTIGAALTPALLEAMLAERGFTDIRREEVALNELRITGRDANGTQATFLLAAHGSSTGFKALKDGSAHLAASSRPIKSSEATDLVHLGNMLTPQGEHVIAIDGLAVITSPGNPVQRLSITDIARIFSGQVTNWSEVGGVSGPIHLYARDEQSGTWDTFKSLVLESNGLQLSPDARRYESSDQLSELVSRDPLGIGFVGLPSIRKAQAVAISSGESQAMAPTRDLVASEDYPLSRRLFLYTPPEEKGWAQALANYAESEAGQAIVERQGFVSQSVQAMQVSPSADMPAEYLELASKARRLNTTFRFAEGSATLDTKAMRDVERVVEYLKKHDKLKGEVVLVGFGDPRANVDHSLLISKLRAITVQRQLVKTGVLVRDNLGMGDALPVADNQSEEGRRKNRRVEVWVY